MTTHVDLDTGGQDVAFVKGLTEFQCKKLLDKYPEGCHVAYFKDRNPTECYVHRYGYPVKSSSSEAVSWDRKEVSDPRCPYGHRYRDVCLVLMRQTANYNSHVNWCRSMGGKLTMPIDGDRKSSIGYAVNTEIYIDFTDYSGTYKTDYPNQALNNPYWRAWDWIPG